MHKEEKESRILCKNRNEVSARHYVLVWGKCKTF
jgi:hypothetical protein